MELELGLKITRTRDDITSFSDLRIAKDQTGPVFFSRETETMFILIVYLKGYRKENIEIMINQDGTQIAISGRKPVQEMVLTGWMMHKKEVELRAFRKVFKIPNGVILDQIKAKFSSENATLTITMPKLVKGVRGFVIEEVKEPKVAEVVNDQIPRTEEGKEALIEDTVKPMIESEEKPSQVEKQVVDQKRFKTKEELPAEAKTRDGYEEKEEIMDEKADGVSKNISKEIVPRIELERDEYKETPKPETKDSKESKAVPEIAEPPAFSAAIPEDGNMEPEECVGDREIEHPQMGATPTTEETQDADKNGKERKSLQTDILEEETLADRIHESESTESNEPEMSLVSEETEAPQPSSVQAEEEHITELDHQEEGTESVPASENHIVDTTTEEAIKPKPDKEKEQAETPESADELQDVFASEEAQAEEQCHRQEEIHGIDDEFEETSDQTPESQAKEETNETTRSVRKRRKKPCPPLVIAGSAVLISFIVLVINLIRAEKR